MPTAPEPKGRSKRETAVASGLVTAAEVEAASVVARDRLPGSATPEQALDDATIEVLIEQGKLTPFQAREIGAGRTRFRLGQYTVIDEIGRGGMGQVFKAEHALMGRHVAVKVLPRAKATPESEAAFRREVRILGRLDHENLVRAFDAGYDAMVYYLVTELVAGLDMRRHVRAFGPIGETEAASVFVQVAKALSFAHEQRLIHRDVKPGNIIVMDDGRAKLLDLGLAGSSLEEEAIRLGRVVGTMDYIAPEQIRSPDDVGPPADVYALGCTLYFAITGRVPFPGGTRKEKMQRHLAEQPTPIRELAPQVSPAFCSVVEAMMAKSEGQRIGSAAEVIARLRPWTPEHTVPLPRLPAGRTPRPAAAPGGDGGDSWGSHGAGESSTPGLEADTSLLREPPAVPPPAADWQERLVAGVEGTIGILANPRTAVPTLVRGLIAAAVGAAVIAGVRSASSEWSLGLPAFVTPATCGFTVFVVAVTRQVVKRLESRPRGTREPR